MVGNSLHFPFNYGLPLGLTMIKRHTLNSIDFPENVKGRETYYIQSYLRKQKLKVRYVNNSMIHTYTLKSLDTGRICLCKAYCWIHTERIPLFVARCVSYAQQFEKCEEFPVYTNLLDKID